MERREIIGSVVQTTLANTISNSDTTIDLFNGSTFPTGSSNPFVIVIDRGSEQEEKILVSSRTGNQLSVLERGYDGVGANTHTSGATVDHVLDAYSIQDMNKTTYDNQILYWVGA
jgi:hypothetical protein